MAIRGLLFRLLPQILPQRRPIVFLPAFGDSLVILFGDIDVNQIDPALFALVREGQDQDRIQVSNPEVLAAPALHDEFAGQGEDG